MKNIYPILLLLFTASCWVTFSSCNKSIDLETLPPNNTPANTMDVTIDTMHCSWEATGTYIPNSGVTTITVEGMNINDNGSGVGFTITNITKPGKYDVAAPNVTMSSENMTYPPTTYSSSTSGGIFIVQFINPDSLKATFNATLTKGSGPDMAAATIKVIGSVNVSFQKP